MPFYDGVQGIAGDRVFMDHYYVYRKFKLESEKSEDVSEAEKKHGCENFMAALERCVMQIEKFCVGDIQQNYLDWLRWNQNIIFAELCSFKEDPEFCLDDNRMKAIKAKIVALMEANFQLNEAEKGISNEYAHAFQHIQRKNANSKNVRPHVLKQASRLLINYINLLTEKCYTQTFDRDNYSIETLESEMFDLKKGLLDIDIKLASDIETAVKMFITFRGMDKDKAIGQDHLMQNALKLAHKRDTENFLQTALRQIRETISQIEEAASQKMKNVVKTVLLNSATNKMQTLKSLKNFVKHPKRSVSALIKYASKHKFQFVGIALGGLIVGLISGGIAFGSFFLLDMAITSVSFPVVTMGVSAATASVCSAATVNFAVTASEIEKINSETQQEIAVEKAKEAALIEKDQEEGNTISNDARFDQARREILQKTEEEIKKRKLLFKKMAAARKQQIDSMNVGELEAHQNQLKSDAEEIQSEIQKVQDKSERQAQNLIAMQKKLDKIGDGQAAAAWIVKNLKEKNSTSFLDDDDDDDEEEVEKIDSESESDISDME